MTKVLVLYYSSYGHIETMAYAVAEGAREAGAEVDVKRVPETRAGRDRRASPASSSTRRRRSPRSTSCRLRRHHHRHADALRQHDGADEELPRPDRRPLGAGHAGRQGRLGLHLHAPPSTAARRARSSRSPLLHQGMVIVGLPYSFAGQMGVDEITGGSPYGASTIAGGDGSRQPSDTSSHGARFQGKHVAADRRQAGGTLTAS